MKVLHILDHSIPLHSGYTFRTRAILEHQRKLGWETAHITSAKHNAPCGDEETVDGLHFYRTNISKSIFGKIPILNQLNVVNTLTDRLNKVIEKENPDILHAHSPSLNGLAALRARRKYGIPVVYECRAFWEDAAVDHGTSKEGGVRYNLTRAIETRVFQKADAVTTICEGLKEDILSRGIHKKKITVIPNAVDIERFVPDFKHDESLSKRFGLENKTVIGFIGSFYAYEGLKFLVSAMPKIVDQMPEIRLLLVGGGPQEECLQNLVRKENLEKIVKFTGRVSHNEVDRYYSLIDIFIYPREHMRLTDLVTPLKPLEAMAQAKLVLASDVGGHRELIKEGYNGWIFKAHNINSLIDKLTLILDVKNQWANVRANGRRFVEEERNWDVSIARYRDIYESLI